MTLRILNYPDEKALYLLLNIVAHDVIHDYGSGSSPERWEKNINLVRQFSNEYNASTFGLTGGTMQRTLLHQKAFKNRGLASETALERMKKKRSSYNTSQKIKKAAKFDKIRFPGPGLRLGSDDKYVNYLNYLNALDEMKNEINNYTIFTFFNHFLYYRILGLVTDTIDYRSSEEFIIPFDTDVINEDYKDIFQDLSNKFVGYCAISRIPPTLHYNDFLQVLCVFLSTDSTIQCILENILYITTGSETIGSALGVIDDDMASMYGGFKNKKGGKKEARGRELTPDEARTLVSQITGLNSSEEINENLSNINAIYQEYLKNEGVIPEDMKQRYKNLKRDLLTRYKTVFTEFGETKMAGSIDGNPTLLPDVSKRFSRLSQQSAEVERIFKEKIQIMLLGYIGIISKAEKDAQEVEKRRLREESALATGKLTQADKNVREQFSSFIAKSGLFLTGVCNSVGTINSELNPDAIDSALKIEINILLYQAGWTGNPRWQEVTRIDLDDILIDYFDSIIPDITGRVVCHRFSNYVINNAAPIETALDNKTFCPYTSILDGMVQCSWGSSRGNIERGNINFKITSENNLIFYNGSLIVLPVAPDMKEKVRTGFNVNLGRVSFSATKEMTIGGNDLHAHVVLKNTLVKVIEHITSSENIQEYFGGDNIFGNLFNIFTRAPEEFNTVYSEILFKGTGDLFQEINSVCKFGGYTMENYYADSGIAPINTSSGEQIRFFAANDRPSGTRFIYMLQNGRSDEINMKAVGGYYSKNKLVLFKRDENTNICQLITTGGKFTKKNRKTGKIRINTSKRNKYKSKKNKYNSRKNKYKSRKNN